MDGAILRWLNGGVGELVETRGSSGGELAAIVAVTISATMAVAGIGALVYVLWRRRSRPSAAET